MLTEPQIAFHGIAPTAELEAEVRERIAWLGKFYEDIVSCRVVVDVPDRHQSAGRHFHVNIELTVPGGEMIVIGHEPSRHAALKDAHAVEHAKVDDVQNVHRHARAAIHDAFDAARRRLQDFARRQRGAVKTHRRT